MMTTLCSGWVVVKDYLFLQTYEETVHTGIIWYCVKYHYYVHVYDSFRPRRLFEHL